MTVKTCCGVLYRILYLNIDFAKSIGKSSSPRSDRSGGTALHRRRLVPAGHRAGHELAVDELLEQLLGSHAVPMAEAARPDLRHLRRGHRDLQLLGEAIGQ